MSTPAPYTPAPSTTFAPSTTSAPSTTFAPSTTSAPSTTFAPSTTSAPSTTFAPSTTPAPKTETSNTMAYVCYALMTASLLVVTFRSCSGYAKTMAVLCCMSMACVSSNMVMAQGASEEKAKDSSTIRAFMCCCSASLLCCGALAAVHGKAGCLLEN